MMRIDYLLKIYVLVSIGGVITAGHVSLAGAGETAQSLDHIVANGHNEGKYFTFIPPKAEEAPLKVKLTAQMMAPVHFSAPLIALSNFLTQIVNIASQKEGETAENPLQIIYTSSFQGFSLQEIHDLLTQCLNPASLSDYFRNTALSDLLRILQLNLFLDIKDEAGTSFLHDKALDVLISRVNDGPINTRDPELIAIIEKINGNGIAAASSSTIAIPRLPQILEQQLVTALRQQHPEEPVKEFLQQDPQNVIAWSPDGEYIASGSNSSGVRLLNPNTGAVIARIAQKAGSIQSLSWNPTNTYIALASSHPSAVSIWDRESMQEVKQLMQEQGAQIKVAWSPDGKYLACALSERQEKESAIYLFDAHALETQPKELLVEGNESLTAIAWSPSSAYIAASTNENRLVLWKLDTKKPVATSSKRPKSMNSIAWSPNNQTIIASEGRAARREEGAISFFNAENLTLKEALPLNVPVLSAEYSHNGEYIAAGTGKELYVLQATTKKLLNIFTKKGIDNDGIAHVSWNHDDSQIATLGILYDWNIRLWSYKPKEHILASIYKKVIDENKNKVLGLSINQHAKIESKTSSYPHISRSGSRASTSKKKDAHMPDTYEVHYQHQSEEKKN